MHASDHRLERPPPIVSRSAIASPGTPRPANHPPAGTSRFCTLAESSQLLHQRTGRKELLSRTVRETEAEVVAFVVCRALGLETTTRSADYIQLYRGNSQTLSDSSDMIQKTAATLIVQLQDESNDSQQEEHGRCHLCA